MAKTDERYMRLQQQIRAPLRYPLQKYHCRLFRNECSITIFLYFIMMIDTSVYECVTLLQ